MVSTWVIVAVLLVAGSTVAVRAVGWQEVEQDGDLPWLSHGERAKRFRKQKASFMSTTGTRTLDRWGRSHWRGEAPYDTAWSAVRFLHESGALYEWPESKTSGTTTIAGEFVRARVAPYEFFIVMLEPTVVVMRFDLGAVAEVIPKPEHWLSNPRLANRIRYGTRIPASSQLLWFSPAANQKPTPVPMVSPDRGEIELRGIRIPIERGPGGWTVGAPEP